MEERGFMSPSLAISASYRQGGSKGMSRRRSMRPSLDADNEFMNVLHGSDPVRIELNRLENEVRDKDRELSEGQAEIKALRLSERQREKAVEECITILRLCQRILLCHINSLKSWERWRKNSKLIENLLESKNLEIKKINEEKKASMAAQFAAEASLRRIAKLQDDNKSLDHLTKSKEAALLDVEKTVQSALAKASMVDDLQNKNQELMKQIEICQEENKIIDKMHRQKVAEVEKLMQSVRELEEAVLAGGAAANAVRDYQRKFQEMNEERKNLERELARAKVNANRVATVVANEWKDTNDKVMPELLLLLIFGEILLLLRVLEESLKGPTSSSSRGTSVGRSSSNGPSRRQALGGAETSPKITSNGSLIKRTPSSQLRSLTASASTVLKHAKGTSRSLMGTPLDTRSLDRSKVLINGPRSNFSLNHQSSEGTSRGETPSSIKGEAEADDKSTNNDSVPSVLYDLLQKEVITIRKAAHDKDQSLRDKDEAIEMLAKKVETLTKAMDVEAKKMRREVAVMGKEVAAMRVDKGQQDSKTRRLSASKGNTAQLLSGRVSGRIGMTRSTQ
ncbi:hypothetical protein ARALYDRAFT_472169 [Arabidopsis lyrata subsp. lyrata]|uniref:Uncharacterized protein n=1 Tax=Arabidopsis lyrata subsp. lyrata TaxID=81972 RepID=D7KHD9_ARALL|nr:hypothetical protein ARALYDRAFT_472169 [Arabidopsis lyrata subsp. lyrata]